MKNKPSGQHRNSELPLSGSCVIGQRLLPNEIFAGLMYPNSIYFVPNVPIQGVLEGQSIWVVVKIRVPFGVP